jgi:hypothetical protein
MWSGLDCGEVGLPFQTARFGEPVIVPRLVLHTIAFVYEYFVQLNIYKMQIQTLPGPFSCQCISQETRTEYPSLPRLLVLQNCSFPYSHALVSRAAVL